jgi:hypothetical protein
LKRSAGALDRHSDPERTQHAHCVRLKRNSGAGGPPFRLALYELGAKSTLPQGDGGRQSRNPAADNEDTFDLCHRKPHFGC